MEIYHCVITLLAWTLQLVKFSWVSLTELRALARSFMASGRLIGYSKDAPHRMCEEQNDFYWFSEMRGGVWWCGGHRAFASTPHHLSLLSPSQ